MPETFFTKELPNGLTLLGQHMEAVSSAAVSLLVSAGSAYDPPELAGSAAVSTEWLFRGAGGRNTRQLNEALDRLGCHHDQHAQSEHIHLTAAQLGRNLPEVMAIYADVIRRPRLEEATFEPCRALTQQDLAALEDEPARKCHLLLRERFYPHPLGRSVYGTAETLAALTPEALGRHLRAHLTPHGAMLSVAGNVDWGRFCDLAEGLMGDWTGAPAAPVNPAPAAGGITHIRKETAQVQIALACRSAPVSHRGYYPARLAEMVLSGGMSSRLFTEVREKRGLAYSVGARYHCLKDHAGLFAYAGTRPELAQQSLEVAVGELRRLVEGIQQEEITRSRTQLKSALIMQGESTSARAAALASDWYHLRRLRSLQEISDAIDKVAVDDVLEHLREFPPRDFTALFIGPEPLNTAILNE